MSNQYMYLFVRTDISLADQACQIAHAAAGAAARFKHPDDCNLVLIQVPDLQALFAATWIAVQQGIKGYVNYEPDDNMGFTAYCTEPIHGSKRKVFSNYKLWRGAA